MSHSDSGVKVGIGRQQTSVALGKLLQLFGLQFPHLENGGTTLPVTGVQDMMCTPHLAQSWHGAQEIPAVRYYYYDDHFLYMSSQGCAQDGVRSVLGHGAGFVTHVVRAGTWGNKKQANV